MSTLTKNIQAKPRLRPELAAFLRAHNAMLAAKKACQAAFRAAYPRGAEVEWMHGEFLQRGEIVMHGYQRVKVLNRRSGREVWIDEGRLRHE